MEQRVEEPVEILETSSILGAERWSRTKRLR